MIIYTNETCPYCKQIKEELNKNGIGYTERLTNDWETEWKDVSMLTGIPSVPTISHEDKFLVPGRDFRSASHLIDIIKGYGESSFSIEKQTLEKLKTLTYNISVAFGRTDQLLRQVENKLNPKEDNEKV
mgnify:FL=1